MGGKSLPWCKSKQGLTATFYNSDYVFQASSNASNADECHLGVCTEDLQNILDLSNITISFYVRGDDWKNLFDLITLYY